MGADRNFVPAVRCPNCNKPAHAEISGWGRTGLNVRGKHCRYCETEYDVVSYVFTATKGTYVSDGQITGLGLQIKHEKDRRHRQKEALVKKLLLEQETTLGLNN